uniref:Low-density lipoprotein receptor-related protein 1-like n=1 Tax=Phallusia mammillata TaxID=59560 RepID=A0A6F9DKI0_9ASCI|nr:low-density lipoprotein receptor-related protein 1-like [Phallusia mammillata]
MVPIENLQIPRAMDYYKDEDGLDWVVYSDISTYEMSRRRLLPEIGVEATTEVLINSTFHDVEGLAVDWISFNVYWTDDGYETVNLARLPRATLVASDDNYMRKVLVRGNLSHPRAIALDPIEGMMYWTQWQMARSHPGYHGSIEMAWMDGSHRSTLVSSKLKQLLKSPL